MFSSLSLLNNSNTKTSYDSGTLDYRTRNAGSAQYSRQSVGGLDDHAELVDVFFA